MAKCAGRFLNSKKIASVYHLKHRNSCRRRQIESKEVTLIMKRAMMIDYQGLLPLVVNLMLVSNQ